MRDHAKIPRKTNNWPKLYHGGGGGRKGGLYHALHPSIIDWVGNWYSQNILSTETCSPTGGQWVPRRTDNAILSSTSEGRSGLALTKEMMRQWKAATNTLPGIGVRPVSTAVPFDVTCPLMTGIELSVARRWNEDMISKELTWNLLVLG